VKCGYKNTLLLSEEKEVFLCGLNDR